jgi:hypothetical protein
MTTELIPTYHAFAVPPIDDEIRQLTNELGILLEKARLVTENDYESDGVSGPETGAASDGKGWGQTIVSLKTYITCLMDLLPSMEDTLNYADQTNLDEQASAPTEFQVSGPAQTYVLNVYDRFAEADSRLVERLGEANWQRHTALRMGLEGQTETTLKVQETPKSVFIPVSMFHDSGLGSSVPAMSSYAATVASHSSFVSSLAEKDSGSLRVPSTPKKVSEGVPFTCNICGHKLSRIKNRVDWKYVAMHPL